MVIPSGKPVVLLGFMGSGKSTLGKQLATRLRWKFTDLDRIIEADAGETIPEIFSHQGEKAFRTLETAALTRILQRPYQVVAIGGGAPCHAGNMEIIRQQATSIYLRISEKELVNRLLQSTSPRPLLAGKDEKGIATVVHELLMERESFYLQADYIMESDTIGADDLVNRLENDPDRQVNS